MTLPRIGALLPFLMMVLILRVPAARADGDARHMSGPLDHLALSARPGCCAGTGRGWRRSPSLLVPWLFYDWTKGRHSGFVLTMMSEIGVMAIFALSYNMLMGQAGLLSFGHAVLFGLGGYCAAHVAEPGQGRQRLAADRAGAAGRRARRARSSAIVLG